MTDELTNVQEVTRYPRVPVQMITNHTLAAFHRRAA